MPTSFTCTNINLFKPCKRFLIKLFKKPVSLKPFRFRTLIARRMGPSGGSRRSGLLRSSLRAAFWRRLASSARPAEAIDRVGELPGLAVDRVRVRAPLPSPVTPAYVKIARLRGEEGIDEAEEACRSFERCLKEMIAEEGRVRDLVDVEELLYCWESLRCPAFVELVCRFYGELCKDLFSNNEGGVVEDPVST